MKSAVLFLVFNRPDTTKQVFEAIRKAQPPRLYVAADGPRADRQGERERCEEVRRIATAVDWECEVKTLFREKNLGCKIGVSSGIDWFFEHEEEGIILEDDCLPSQSFFDFCDQTLSIHRGDNRVWQISGSLFFEAKKGKSYGDYFYSRYGPVWGWATWRRAWMNYDVNLQEWEKMKEISVIDNVYENKCERKKKKELGDLLYYGAIDTWDYQWGFIKNYNNALTVLPKINLVRNIGFGAEATHTVSLNSSAPDKVFDFYDEIKHPYFVIRDVFYDNYFSEKVFVCDSVLSRLIKFILR